MKCIAYYRVSTKRQGANGYGIDAQKKSVATYIENKHGYELIGEYKEIESGTKFERKKLATALRRCRQHKATLIIAKLDRLTRSLPMLMEIEDSGVDFECVEMPGADKTTVRLIVTIAEREVELIRKRTKEGLEIAKAKGKKLGNPQLLNGTVVLGCARTAKIARTAKTKYAESWAKDYLPDLVDAERKAKKEKVNPTLQYIANYFNSKGLKTRTGKDWTTRNVQLLKQRSTAISTPTV